MTFDNATDQQLADALANVYMPISRDAGRLLYSLVRAIRPTTVVEFGMSMGIFHPLPGGGDRRQRHRASDYDRIEHAKDRTGYGTPRRG
jgi:hypothetical protein